MVVLFVYIYVYSKNMFLTENENFQNGGSKLRMFCVVFSFHQHTIKGGSVAGWTLVNMEVYYEGRRRVEGNVISKAKPPSAYGWIHPTYNM